MLKNIIVTVFCCLMLNITNGQSVTVPNTFTAGTPAKASEVNANFTALANAVNDAPKPLMVYDSTGKVIGYFEGAINPNKSQVIIVSPTEGLLSVPFTKNGFGFPVYFNVDYIPLYYSTTDCSGDPYFEAKWFSAQEDSYHLHQVYLAPPDSGSWTVDQARVGYYFNNYWDFTGSVGTILSKRIPAVTNSISCEQYQSTGGVSFIRTKKLDLSVFIPPFSVH